jgi:hypothetical protein
MRRGIIAVFSIFTLTACGSGGGGIPEDPSGPPSGCFEAVTKTLSGLDLTVVSKDLNATVILDPSASGGSFAVTITVLCGFDTTAPPPRNFNGKAYEVRVSGNIVPQYNLIINYDPKGVDESTLRIGRLDDPIVGWQALDVANVVSPPSGGSAAAQGLTDSPVTYGIFVASSGSTTGSPPTQPTNVKATVPSPNTCQINITWNQSTDPDGDLSSYIVFRDSANIGVVDVTSCPGTQCTFSDTQAIPNKLLAGPHSYYIRATDRAGHDSLESVVVSASAPLICGTS